MRMRNLVAPTSRWSLDSGTMESYAAAGPQQQKLMS